MRLRWAGLSFLGLLLLAALISGLVVGPEVDVEQALQMPSWQHWFGTDSLGRDLLLRILQGSRVSLLIGIVTTAGSFLLGTAYALLAYRLGGWRDQALMRLVEILLGLPSIVLIAVLVLFFSNIWVERSFITQLIILSLALTLTMWMWVARQVRTWIAAIATRNFVEAEYALGASWGRIAIRHILPNMMGALLVFVGLQIPQHLLFESFLSFVGIGIQPPMASWGVLIQEGWKTLSVYPHLILFPGGVLFLTVFSFNVVFEAFRDALDPRMK